MCCLTAGNVSGTRFRCGDRYPGALGLQSNAHAVALRAAASEGAVMSALAEIILQSLRPSENDSLGVIVAARRMIVRLDDLLAASTDALIEGFAQDTETLLHFVGSLSDSSAWDRAIAPLLDWYMTAEGTAEAERLRAALIVASSSLAVPSATRRRAIELASTAIETMKAEVVR